VKILLDACTPRPLRSFLAGHPAVRTTRDPLDRINDKAGMIISRPV
jgi:hypothetical protein